MWTAALVAPPSHRRQDRVACSRMGFFDQLGAAFANDDDLGDRKEAGLAKAAEYHEITWKGPKPFFGDAPTMKTQTIAGQKLEMLGRQAGIPIEYSCMQGTCRLCDVLVDGKRVPACLATAPKKTCVIEYGVPRAKPEQPRATSTNSRGVIKPSNSGGSAGGDADGGGGGGSAVVEETAAEKQARLMAQLMGENAAKSGKKKSPFGF